MTPHMRRLLLYIAERLSAGETPSYEEMRVAMGLKAKSGIVRLIDELEERGYVKRMRQHARSVELTAKARTFLGAPSSPSAHLMWALETQRPGQPPVIQPLSLCFMPSDLGKRMQPVTTMTHRKVRVRVTIEEVKE